VIDRALGGSADGDYAVDCDATRPIAEDEITRRIKNLVDRMTLWSRHISIIDETVYYVAVSLHPA